MAELTIRPFINADLPGMFEVWMEHWEAARYQIHVSMTALERAVLSRLFFDRDGLLVAISGDRLVAWSHHFIDEIPDSGERIATIAALCFAGEEGLRACDPLLTATEDACRRASTDRVRFGVAQDDRYGYAGLDPIGHGIGVPTADARTSSLLSRSGYGVDGTWQRMTATTSSYRVRANREFMQLRRQCRIDVRSALPRMSNRAIALSHLDVETHQLVNHVQRQVTAQLDLWLSDLEVQIMNGGNCILPLPPQPLTLEQRFLISIVIPTLGSRNVYEVETAVEASQTELIEQLETLQFKITEQGRCWSKMLDRD